MQKFGLWVNRKKSRLGTNASKNKSIIDASRRFQPDSMVTSIMDDPVTVNKEEFSQNKTEILLHKIANKHIENKSPEWSEFCIENSKSDFAFLSELQTTITGWTKFNFTSPKEEGEKYKLVESSIVSKYREENASYLKTINKWKVKLDEIKKKIFQTSGENNFVKQASEYQNLLKSDNAKQLIQMDKMLKECRLENKRWREDLTSKKIAKDALFNAVYNYTAKFNPEIANEIKDLYQCYNNQLFWIRNKPLDENYLDEWFNKISVIEKKIAVKNKEIEHWEKYVIPSIQKKTRRKSLLGSSQNIKKTSTS